MRGIREFPCCCCFRRLSEIFNVHGDDRANRLVHCNREPRFDRAKLELNAKAP
jgi:hypothetical protein